ncbi:tRNA (cmo5U34)-methyltransferase [Thermotomaculum hydrothermale]|uniref:Carboxy-S-adenosyl-L-methionine synthase n=1 Tax=Thermotomaculum hydrothermale TaxID=981385 RepID=A0A7R6PMV6_9BACT|nr:carboxy-S-adenosyl-L-methionine synthase CmoA [Thermotomaculum hydrothermale]BBB33007.1 tRNA (cmo5U34)-methyltransferase [Thermotomaculum hydrothermale]
MEEKKDRIFQVEKIESDFRFDREVANIFDDMLNRSIPFYRQVIEATGEILLKTMPDNPKIYDLGCSTGNTLIYLASILKDKKPELIGVDNSRDMVEKAREKAKAYNKKIEFVVSDIEKIEIKNADAVIMNYTLQFIRPLKRPQIIEKIYNGLKENGIFILSEKVIFEHPKLNRNFVEIYYNFKKKQGYSELEIAKKREALENVLIPFTINENIQLLKNAGFSYTTPFFQWINFTSFIGIK